MRIKHLLLLTATVVLAFAPGPARAADRVDFNRQIKPILEVNCVRCHGPEKPKGRLRLDTLAGALKGGDNGTALVPGKPDQNILSLVEGADLMIYDSTYTDAEFPAKRSWGHSTWQEGVRLANAAQVKTLVLFHHDPDHDDAFMDRVAAEAETARPGTIVAHEGLVLEP